MTTIVDSSVNFGSSELSSDPTDIVRYKKNLKNFEKIKKKIIWKLKQKK